MPEGWELSLYRIYSPQWLPNGVRDLAKAFRRRRLDSRTTETLVVVPGWNRAPILSALILRSAMRPSLREKPTDAAIMFTFPFYSAVALWAKERFPALRVVYHAHDPFEFYGYREGYTLAHEDRIVPICDRVFAISQKLRDDLSDRYPSANVAVLGNAVSSEFLRPPAAAGLPPDIEKIREKGAPVVGVVGQINGLYDMDLLEASALGNPRAQFVFIGHLFEEGQPTERIRRFFKRDNVHWLGPKAHKALKSYMEGCDVLLNPLTVNAQNDRRDPLRIYDYLSTCAMVVSTPLGGAERHGRFVKIVSTASEMKALLDQLPHALSDDEMRKRNSYLLRNTWTSRGEQLAQALSSARSFVK
jgi:hypothetical protein